MFQAGFENKHGRKTVFNNIGNSNEVYFEKIKVNV